MTTGVCENAGRTGTRGAGLLCRSVLSVPASTGRPGLAASALCRAANDTGGGGGALLVTTVRSKAAAGARQDTSKADSAKKDSASIPGITGGVVSKMILAGQIPGQFLFEVHHKSKLNQNVR